MQTIWAKVSSNRDYTLQCSMCHKMFKRQISPTSMAHAIICNSCCEQSQEPKEGISENEISAKE